METINGIFILVCMVTLSGSMIGSFFLASQTLVYDFTSADFTAKLNKFVMLSFAVPYFLPWAVLEGSVQVMRKYSDLVVVLEEGTLKNAIYTLREAVHFADVVTILWPAGMGAYLLFHAAAYAVFCRNVAKHSREIQGGVWQAECSVLCGERGWKPEKLKLLSTTAVARVCTIGVARHVILVPEYLLEKLEPQEINIVLRHEMMHIEKHDVAAKISALVLCGIFWFNPLAHAVKKVLFKWLELRCDEAVLEVAGESSRRAYSETLLKMIREQQGQKRQEGQSAAACFSREQNTDFVKRRMEGVFQKKRGTAKLAKTIILTGTACMVTYATVFAKDMGYATLSVFSNHLGFFEKDELIIEQNPKDETTFEYVPVGQETLLEGILPVMGGAAEYCIVYPDGTQEKFSGQDADAPPHEHSFLDANLKWHRKNDDTSCHTSTYAGRVCEICGKLLTSSNRIQYGKMTKCLHE